MPNPMVGAVLANQDRVLASGWHQFFGGAHAEVNALAGLSRADIPSNATLYVNLEPCSHHGKTPPCVGRIIELGIKRVVISQRDPNPKINGAGIAQLKARAIEIVEGVLEEESRAINRRFMSLHQRKRPYVILKWAQTADGFIARSDYSSRWISSASSRTLTHRWRSQEQAILVGFRTALHDNPALTVRLVDGVNPLRFLVDRKLELPSSHQLLSDGAATVVYNAVRNKTRGNNNFVKLNFSADVSSQILCDMAQREIVSLIVEGGATSLQHFIDNNQWDEARIFIASSTKFGNGVAAPKIDLTRAVKQQYGGDLLLTLEN